MGSYYNSISYMSRVLSDRILPQIYERVIGEKTSVEINHFFRNIIYVSIGTFLGSGCFFIFNISAGRILGPTQYGKFALINSIAMFMSVPMIFGISTSMVKYNSEKKDISRGKKIISTSYILLSIFTAISLCIYYLFSNMIADYFLTSNELIYLSMIFAFSYVLNTISIDTLRGLHELKIVSIIRSAFGIILLLSLAITVLFGNFSLKTMLGSTYVAYLLTSLLTLPLVYKYFKLEFSISWAKELLEYGTFGLFSNTAFILYTNVGKILINKYMLVDQLGIYSAYTTSSTSIFGVFSVILMTVLFPTLSKYEDKTMVVKKINKFIPYIVSLGILFAITTLYLTLSLFGEKYPLNFLLILFFSVASVLYLCYEIYAWTFNSIGIRGIKLTMFGTTTVAVVNLVLSLYLIPRYGLHGAIGATAIAYLIGIIIIYGKWKRSEKILNF